MPDLLRAIIAMLIGGVFITVGVLLWRHAEGAATSFHRQGSTLFGKKTADTVYVAANVRWGAGVSVVMGAIVVVTGLVSTIRLL